MPMVTSLSVDDILLPRCVNWSTNFRNLSLNLKIAGPVGWGCRLHQLRLGWVVRPCQCVSWIWHLTIWWWGSSDDWALGKAGYLFIAIVSRSTLARSGNILFGPMYGLNKNKLYICGNQLFRIEQLLNLTVWRIGRYIGRSDKMMKNMWKSGYTKTQTIDSV